MNTYLVWFLGISFILLIITIATTTKINIAMYAADSYDTNITSTSQSTLSNRSSDPNAAWASVVALL